MPATASTGIGAQRLNDTTDDERRIGAGASQDPGDHAGRGRFAVRAGNRDPYLVAHNPCHRLSQELGPPVDRESTAPCFDDLGIVSRNGRRDQHCICVPDVRSIVPDRNHSPHL